LGLFLTTNSNAACFWKKNKRICSI
jgi:hypothetical protein